MVFQCINIRQVPWEVLKTAAFGLGFQHLPRDLANINAWKTIFDPYNKRHLQTAYIQMTRLIMTLSLSALHINFPIERLFKKATKTTSLVWNLAPKELKKKNKIKVQGVPQSQTAALPRYQEEEETDKTKQAQIEQTYEKH